MRCRPDFEESKELVEETDSADMEQVKELLELMRGMKVSRVVVAMNFIQHRI